ncbi:immunomodulatory protein [Pterulicium gracile]|uniref:Immunomodulatory protein n=1 Tax=Pterulicium gracile TaxID=1884261 RepID=A0A5C3QXZ6_9AGAR|nr:immunomodulatory protein [Pterula gracilis]
MKFFAIVASLLAAVPLIQAITVAYDPVYDKRANSMEIVACSDGENGLITQGKSAVAFSTLGPVPRFPNIGAAAAVADWNSPNCGTCWQLTYKSSANITRTVNITAVDHADAGFVLSLAAMNTLTGGLGTQLGRINATSKQVPLSSCGR